MNNETCKMKGCCGKFFLSAAAVFIFLIAAGYLIHHVWLMPIYEQTASLWRPKGEMEKYFPWMIASYAVLSLLFTALYAKIKKAKMAACSTDAQATAESGCAIGGPDCAIKRGVCFGTLIGLLMGTLCASSAIWMPIPAPLPLYWFLADLAQGIGIGLILSFSFCPKKTDAA